MNICLSFVSSQNHKINHFLLLAISLMTFNVMSYVIASSLFLSNIGAKKLAFVYILIGIFSSFAYSFIAKIVDTNYRSNLFKKVLFSTIILVILLRLALFLKSPIVYYCIFIAVYFLFDFYLSIIFPSLISDYLTALEYKKYSPIFSIAMAVGGLIAGFLVSLFSPYLSASNLLLILPFLSVISMAQIGYLEKSLQPINSHKSNSQPTFSIDFLEDLRKLNKLVRKYPLIIFLAFSSFLFMILFILGEFLYSSLYSQEISASEDLTNFLGKVRILNNLIQLIVLYFVTLPLINKLGISKMNLVYALTTLSSFITLAFNPSLPIAVLVNINNDSFEKSLNKPVYSLNYNALPHQFAGRIRTFCDGLLYSFALIIAGFIIALSQSLLTLSQISYFCIILSFLFLTARYLLSKTYVTSLLTMLRSHQVNFEEVNQGFEQLPAPYTKEIKQLLKGTEQDKLLGLDLGIKLQNPEFLLIEVESLFELKVIDRDLQRYLVNFLSETSNNEGIIRYLGSLIFSDQSLKQLIALEALIKANRILTNLELHYLLRHSAQEEVNFFPDKNLNEKEIKTQLVLASEVKALTCLIAEKNLNCDPEITTICQSFWMSEMSTNVQLVVIRAIKNNRDLYLLPVLEKILENSVNYEVKKEALETLLIFEIKDVIKYEKIIQLVLNEANSNKILLRKLAIRILGKTQNKEFLPKIITFLDDRDRLIHLEAIKALGNYNQNCLNLIKPYLYASELATVDAAIAAIGRINSLQAKNLFCDYFEMHSQLILMTQKWLSYLSEDVYYLDSIKILVKDYHARIVHQVFLSINYLDRVQDLSFLIPYLNTNDIRLKANAVETLVSSSYRKLIFPILPLLDSNYNQATLQIAQQKEIQVDEKILERVLSTQDPWLIIATILLQKKQKNNFNFYKNSYCHPLIEKTITQLKQLEHPQGALQEFWLNQLISLKSCSLLNHLFLDELYLLYQELQIKHFMENQIIYHENELIDQIYIICRGDINLYNDRSCMNLNRGDVFGANDKKTCSMTAKANSESIVFVISQYKFKKILELLRNQKQQYNLVN